jgi:REP element-mobilizing transposase RayT
VWSIRRIAARARGDILSQESLSPPEPSRVATAQLPLIVFVMNHQGRPLAYHITFGTYDTRLHGDPRGTVDREHNQFGTPILEPDEERQKEEAARLKFDPIYFTLEQRQFIESVIPRICERGKWQYVVCAAGSDHVHVCLIAPDVPGDCIEPWLKRWLSEALSAKWPLPDGARWWARNGSVKWIFDEAYFRNVKIYIFRQRATVATRDGS